MSRKLYHGTSAWRVKAFLDCQEDLFGVRYRGNPSISATLTNNRTIAVVSADGASIDDALKSNNRPLPVVLTFDLPDQIVICEGSIGNGTAEGFSTNIEARVADLPDGYLDALGISREQAQADVASGKVTFYCVPRRFFRYLD